MQVFRNTKNQNGEAMFFLKRCALFFIIGAIGYMIIELIWRGRTHWTMAIAGGISFFLISIVADKFYNTPLPVKAALCAVAITAIELIFGIIFNVALKMEIWDYSTIPFNFLGQICPLFSLFWFALAFLFLPLAEVINRKIYSQNS